MVCNGVVPILLTAVIALTLPQATAAPSTVESDLTDSARVDVVEKWPFLIRPRREKHRDYCETLGPDQVRVLENGRPVRVIAIDHAQPVTTHALMLDTSASMTDPRRETTRLKGRQTKAAASAYVRWMRADASPSQRLMLLTFDDDLILRSRPRIVTSDGAERELTEIVERIRGGFYTTINDSLLQLLRYLGGRPGRSVVILLSDGADSRSACPQDRILREIARTNNVTLFPIGLGLAEDRHRAFLQRASALSGGCYFELDDLPSDQLARPLEERFRDIRERIGRQRYVSWIADPPGAQPEDSQHRDDLDYTWREVTIRSLDRRCAVIRDGYRPTRYLRWRSEADGATRDDPQPDTERTRDGLELRATDISQDAVPLVGLEDPERATMLVDRRVTVQVPPFDQRFGSRGEARSAADVVFEWLAESESEPLPWRHVMHGKSLLDGREQIARGVFDVFPAYREWAMRKVSEDLRRRLETDFGPEPRGLEGAFDQVVAEHLARLRPEEYAPYLADWLDDVSARQFGFDLEARAANAILSGETARPVLVGWDALRSVLTYPSRVRQVGLLRLVCDPGRDSCGFHRINLPRISALPADPAHPGRKLLVPRTEGQAIERELSDFPTRPYGLIAVRWLLDSPDAAGLMREGLRVVSLEHHPQPPPVGGVGRAETGDRPACRERVSLELLRTAGPGAARLEIVLDGFLEPAPSSPRGVCPAGAVGLRIVPACFAAGGAAPESLLESLETRGLPRCPD